jgi:hypothetical protein
MELMNNNLSHLLPHVCLINCALECVLGDVMTQHKIRLRLFNSSEGVDEEICRLGQLISGALIIARVRSSLTILLDV